MNRFAWDIVLFWALILVGCAALWGWIVCSIVG
jgi:hypothetical protein